jgi:tryptophanyl-tRNA synthetase
VEPGVSLGEDNRCGLGSERVIELCHDYPVSGGFCIQPNAPHDVFIAIYNTVDATNNAPRATCFTEAGFAACARSIATEMQLGTGTTLLMNGFLCTLIGEVLSLAALGAGACLAICDPRADKTLRDQVLNSRATHLMLPPFLLAKAFESLTHEEAQHFYSSVRLIAFGAAPADQAILKRAQELLACEWLHGYGQTQTGGPIIWLRDKERRIGQTGVGTPTKDVSLAIIKSNGQQAAFGEVGEIGIRGSQVFAGYWDPEIGAAVPPEPLPGGWHRTFDLGEIDTDGNLHLRGRVRNDPEKAVIFTQSTIFEHMELAWLLGLCTPLTWLQAVPAYAEKMKKLTGTDLSTIGFLADPLLQAADIFAYGATCIPIGRDQVGHLSFAQNLAERFNSLYADGAMPVLLPPQPHFAKFPALPGLDGDKMSKSYGNAIYMRDGAETVRGKVAAAEVAERATDCANGSLACSDCKSSLCVRILEGLAPYQEKVQTLEQSGDLLDILDKGTTMARTIARGTVEAVRGAMGL